MFRFHVITFIAVRVRTSICSICCMRSTAGSSEIAKALASMEYKSHTDRIVISAWNRTGRRSNIAVPKAVATNAAVTAKLKVLPPMTPEKSTVVTIVAHRAMELILVSRESCLCVLVLISIVANSAV